MFASPIKIPSYQGHVLTLAIVFASAVSCAIAHAQQYVSAPVKLEKNEVGRLKMEFDKAVRNPAGFGAGEADVNTYLKSYFFPMMTQTSPDALGGLADMRKTLFKYIVQAGNASSQQHLIEQTFAFARGMARGNFHPAVRYNAVLMLGDLDQQLAAGANPPVPLPKATQELLELVEQAQFNKIPVPESVKLGALVGLERHTRYGIEPSLGDRLTKAMIAVMASPTPKDVEPDVHDWVRSSAARVLANQSAKAPTKEVQAAITSLISDKKVGLDDRSAAAATMAKITYAAGADIDGNATTNALAELTLDVLTDAGKLARDYRKEALETTDLSAGQGGGYGGRRGGRGGEYGGYGGGYGSGEEDTGPRFERRQLFARLNDIAKGGNSLKAGLSDEDKTRIENLIKELIPLVQVMDDKGATEVDVTDEVIALEESLKNLIKEWGIPVAAAEKKDAAKPADGFAEN